MLRCQSVLALLVALSLLPRPANAQSCQPEWSNDFSADGLDGIVYAYAVFDDDGDGPNPPELYVAGSFTTAGGISANRIAKWDGTSWSPLGKGMNSTVFALAVFDEDGEGGAYPPVLYAAGNFTVAGDTAANRIAKWNGLYWSQVAGGTSSTVFALTVYDADGEGAEDPALYAGGLFVTAGGVSANRIAKWDGTLWSALGEGLNNYVSALCVYDDGDGYPPTLYVGGGFTAAGGISANRIAEWNGMYWAPLDNGFYENGLDSPVYSMTVFDDDGDDPNSNPPALCAGGTFTTAGGISANRIVKWDGKDWLPLGGGMDDPVYAVTVFDQDDNQPDPPALYAGGYFTVAGASSANRIAKWDGTSWSPLESGLDDGVRALAVFDDDGDSSTSRPSALFVGGEFTTAGGMPSAAIARWGCPAPPPEPPQIITQPESQIACEGQIATFSVTAQGTEPLYYQWRKDGIDISGATSDNLVIDPVTPADAGVYDVVVTNDFGSATSDPATLTVNLAVAITTQPQPQSACEGDAVTFTVAADGTGPLEYQWRKDGQPIAGAIQPSYTIDPVTTDDAGDYDVVVTNPCGSLTSDPVTLTVNLPPTITEQPQSQAACEDGVVTFTVTADGTEPLQYQWRKDGQPISGAIDASYTIDPVTAADAGEYDVVVTNTCGSEASDLAILTVDTSPTVTEQPQSQTVCEDGVVTFSVTANGTEPLQYQWQKDGQPIAGATEASYTIDPVTAADAGEYDVVVTNTCGSEASDPAILTVDSSPTITAQPQSQTVCEDDVATFTVTADGTEPLQYQWRKDGQPISGATDASYTIDPVTVADAGEYDVLVTNSCDSVTSDPAILTVETSPTITEQPQSQAGCEGGVVTFTVTASGPEPLEYQWHKNGQPIAGATEASYTIDPVTADDAGDYDVTVSNACGSITSDPATLTVGSEPDISEHPQSQEICEGELVTFAVTADGLEPLEYQWRKDGQPIADAIEASYTIDPVTIGDAGEYDVMVTNLCGSAASDPAMLTVNADAAIVEQPQSQAVCDGGVVTFSVTIHGMEPLDCQWRKDGQPIAGATDTSYTIDPVSVDDAGEYDVVVTNSCGSVTSEAASLTIGTGPAILEHPQSQSACEGATLTLMVTASGLDPLEYQWRKDGQAIADATEASHTIDPVQPDDAGDYDVVVSSACGSATSDPAAISVDAGTTITEQPLSQAICEGDAVTFAVAASGAQPLSYQWRRDGEPIGGATDPSYTIDPVTADDAGEYDAVITNPCGSIMSGAATLTVDDCVDVPEEPYGPNPAPGETQVPVDVELRWTAAGATSYDVYFGTNDPPPFVGNTSTTLWPTADLARGITYYWQVVAVNEAGSTPGPIWSFRTLLPFSSGGSDNGDDDTGTGVDDGDPGDQDADTQPDDSSDDSQDDAASEDQQPTQTIAEEVMPPGCGAGACGTGFVGMAPLTLIGLCGMKRRIHGNRRRQHCRWNVR